jgi:putative transposase
MKQKNFTEEQIALALHQAERTSVEDVTGHLGVSQATFYRWKSKYGGLLPSEVKRMKLIEEENRKLKQLVADLSLDKKMLQDVLAKKG